MARICFQRQLGRQSIMRAIVLCGLTLLMTGCSEPPPQYTGKKYLFDTERCASAGPQGSPEYEACETKLEQEDAKRLYNLRNSGQSVPGFQPPTSLPP
jgi:hypothetical protein